MKPNDIPQDGNQNRRGFLKTGQHRLPPASPPERSLPAWFKSFPYSLRTGRD
jgi:hypothetical protein